MELDFVSGPRMGERREVEGPTGGKGKSMEIH